MEFEKYEAPKGKVYVKDGVASYVVVTPKNSDIIKEYELIDLQKFIKTKENE
jgi:hypothetical protein